MQSLPKIRALVARRPIIITCLRPLSTTATDSLAAAANPAAAATAENKFFRTVDSKPRQPVASYWDVPLARLRHELQQRGLNDQGVKMDVIERLEKHDRRYKAPPTMCTLPRIIKPKIRRKVLKRAARKREREREKALRIAQEKLAADKNHPWALAPEEGVEPPTIEEQVEPPIIEEQVAPPTIEKQVEPPTIEEKPAPSEAPEPYYNPFLDPTIVFVRSFEKLRRIPPTPPWDPNVPKIVRPLGAGAPYPKIRKYESSHTSFPAPTVSASDEGATIRRVPNGPPGPPPGVKGQYRYRQPTNKLAGRLRDYSTLAAVGWGRRGYATQAQQQQLKKPDIASFIPPVIPNPALLESEPPKEPPPIRVPFLPDNVFSRYHRKEFVPEVKPPFKPSISSAESDVSKISPTSALSKVAGGEEEQGKFGWSEWLDEWLFASQKSQQNKQPVLAPRDDDPGPEMTEEKKAALKALAVAAAVWWFFGP